MGISRCDYLLIGAKFNCKAFFKHFDKLDNGDKILDAYHDNSYISTIGNLDGLTAVADGMNNDYAFIGIVKKKARIEHGESLGIINCLDYIDSYELYDVQQMIDKELIKLKLKLKYKIGVWIISHYH